MKLRQILQPVEIHADHPNCAVTYEDSVIACDAHKIVFALFEREQVRALMHEDGIPVTVHIIRNSVRSASKALSRPLSEYALDMFGPTHTIRIGVAIDQGMSEGAANWALSDQRPWVIASICMSVACCLLYHQLNDEFRDRLFYDEPSAARLNEAGMEQFLVSQELCSLYGYLESFGHRRRLDTEQQPDSALASNPLPPPSCLGSTTNATVAHVTGARQGHILSAPPFPSLATNLQPQQALSIRTWPESTPLQHLVDDFCKNPLRPKSKPKLLPISIMIYLHALGLGVVDAVSDLRLAMAKVAASGEPLRKTVTQRSELYGNLANAGRLRSLNRPPSECRNLAHARKRAGKTVKLNNQQELERETRWIGWHAFLAAQMFAAGPLPLPEWNAN